MFNQRINYHSPATTVQQPYCHPEGVAGSILVKLPNVATLYHQLIKAELVTSPLFPVFHRGEK